MIWGVVHLKGDFKTRDNSKSANWSGVGRPILRGGARLFSSRWGAFVMKGACCDFLAQRQLHCVESSTLLASARWTLHRINVLLLKEKPDSNLPAFLSGFCKLLHLTKTCRPRRQKSVKRSWTQTMTERTKPPVRGMAASYSPPFSLSSFS